MEKCRKYVRLIMKIVLLICAVVIFCFASYNLYNYNKGKKESEKLAKEIITQSVDDKKNPIDVDFETLKQKNNDVIGWLWCDGTPINYPIVQAEDNSAYLHKNIDGEYSSAGTLFADYMNAEDFTDNLTIIYGHNMKNDTMFGTLMNYRKQEYYEKHPEMYILTPQKSYVVKLIAGARTDSSSFFYKLPLEDEGKERFVADIVGKSELSSGYTFSVNDRFVMLSTCSNATGSARYVLVGVLNEY